MDCMKRFLKHIWLALALVLMLPACSKGEYAVDNQLGPERYGEPSQEAGVAIGTLRSRDGVRFIRLDGVTCSQIMNGNEVKDIPDGTRVFLQYRCIVAPTVAVADFCADAILVEWASPLDVGAVTDKPYERNVKTAGDDPVDILTDWMTSLEDGFLTLHYSIPTSGSVKHDFSIHPGKSAYEWQLVHNAHGDTKGSLNEGIVCFDVSQWLPDTDGKTVQLSLDYIDLNNTNKRLTVEYQSPK